LPLRQIFVRLACALSLALVAFGHAPLAMQRTDALAAAAHAFPDGSLPFICTTDTAGKSGDKQAHRKGCDACRISSAFFFQAPDCLPSVEPRIIPAVLSRLTAPPVARMAYPPSAPPRAPPLPA